MIIFNMLQSEAPLELARKSFLEAALALRSDANAAAGRELLLRSGPNLLDRTLCCLQPAVETRVDQKVLHNVRLHNKHMRCSLGFQ